MARSVADAEYIDVAFVAGRRWLGDAERHVAIALRRPAAPVDSPPRSDYRPGSGG